MTLKKSGHIGFRHYVESCYNARKKKQRIMYLREEIAPKKKNEKKGRHREKDLPIDGTNQSRRNTVSNDADRRKPTQCCHEGKV